MRRWIGAGIALLSLGGLGGLIVWRLGLQQADAQAQVKQREQRKNAPATVQVSPVTRRELVHTFDGTGSVEAPYTVRLAAKTTGRVLTVLVREGDPVRQGQTLVTLDTTELDARVRQQQAQVAEARARLAQARLIETPTRTGVETQIRQQQASIASTQADEAQARQNSLLNAAAAESMITDAQGKIDEALAAISSAQAGVRSAQANLEHAKTRHARVKSLYDKGFVAGQELDDAATEVQVKAGALDVASAQLHAAEAQRDSAIAQKKVTERQTEVLKNKSKAEIVAASARAAQARAALDSARANRAQRPAYRENLAALQSAVAVAEAGLHDAEAQRADATLLAPMDGFVTARAADPGAVVTAGQAVVTLQATRDVWVSASVPEEQTRRLTVGQSASVSLDALPGKRRLGRIVQINPAADPSSRQFVVRLSLPNADGALKAGMSARVQLETERTAPLLMVPREAIQKGKGGASVVFVVTPDNKAQQVPVTLGPDDTTGISVVSGLRGDETVVTLTAAPLRDGQAVVVGGAKKKSKDKEKAP